MRQLIYACTLLILLIAAGAAPTPADEEGTGQVQLSLEDYTRLVDLARDPSQPPRPAPAGFALGSAQVTVTVAARDKAAGGSIRVRLSIDVLEDEWVLIPVLPPSTPVDSVTIDGKPVQLIATGRGLAWSTKTPGSYTMDLSYKVDASRSETGFTLAVPVPEASAITLTSTLPGENLDVSVIPAAGVNSTSTGGTTRLTATIPTSTGVQISWRTPVRDGHSIDRAIYRGELTGDAVLWTAELGVELFTDETVTLPVLSEDLTLSSLKVDGKAGTILVEDGQFTTLVRGRGRHRVEVGFQVPVESDDGPPWIELEIPEIPVSRFDLKLPGRKELTVDPPSSVSTTVEGEATRARVHVPMTDEVTFSWSEAVPEELRTEVRSNAATYHTVHAEEDVLYVHGVVHYEVNRGETNVIRMQIPEGVQINRIADPGGAVADWRITQAAGGIPRHVSVFLDRQVSGELRFDVHYDISLEKTPNEAGTGVPLLRAMDAQRQRGMVALLSNTDLTLNPVEDTGATRVGENQLPAFVREAVDMTIAHTFKYTERLPALVVEATVPERVRGKFDALIDTLFSLGDVTMTGSATVQVNVKSGGIMDLGLRLPDDVNLLNLAAPSLRTHKVEPGDDGQRIDIEFTQEMQGQFRVELTYERIATGMESRVDVPTVTVPLAEVEQGRIAIEALTAVEVQPAIEEQLSGLDIDELPRQLVLRTTNPILLAYKYVHADTPHRLELEVTRHRVVGIQEAAIDRAEYRTLFTTDGLLVTTAKFNVRNTRKQFLRVRLPENSEVWSAFVNGAPETPALSIDDDGEGSVLIKIINSVRAFPVELIYATRGSAVGGLGWVDGALPRPDILVTESRWDVYLPDDMRYGEPSTNMDLATSGTRVSAREMDGEFAGVEKAASATQAIKPLRIVVPTSGIHFALEKLYANQSDQDTWFRVSYASEGGVFAGRLANLAGVGLLWAGIFVVVRRKRESSALPGLLLATVGLAICIVTVGVYHLSPVPVVAVSVGAAIVLAFLQTRRYLGALEPGAGYPG